MPSNIPSKSDKNGAAEFIKYQKLCDLDYYSRFSREELETKHADILHVCDALKKDTRVWKRKKLQETQTRVKAIDNWLAFWRRVKLQDSQIFCE